MSATRPACVAAAFSLVLILAACGSSSSSTVSNAPAAPSLDKVTVANYSFMPKSLTVKVGTSVTWTNHDQFDHIVVDDHGAFTSDRIHTNASFSHTFGNAGTYSYHCGIHNYMTATVMVTA